MARLQGRIRKIERLVAAVRHSHQGAEKCSFAESEGKGEAGAGSERITR